MLSDIVVDSNYWCKCNLLTCVLIHTECSCSFDGYSNGSIDSKVLKLWSYTKNAICKIILKFEFMKI